MNDIIKTFENDVFIRMNKEYRMNKIYKKFYHTSEKNILSDKHLLLWPFIETIPFSYIDGDVYETLTSFFQDKEDLVLDTILEHDFDLTKAILTFNHISEELNKENAISDLSPQNIFNLDTVYHLEYIKNIEHVYVRLINIIISILDKTVIDKKYSSDEDLAIKLNILKANKLGVLTKYCNTNIRNAIAHGTVFYEMNEIHFYDKKKCKKYTPFEFMKQFDNFLNTCSAILLSIIVIIVNDQNDRIFNDKNVPLGIIFIYISSYLEHKSLEYLYLIKSIIDEGRQQIIFEIKTDSNSRNIHIQESFKLAYFLNTKFKHRFQRLGVHIDSGKSIRSSIFINLDTLDNDVETGCFNNLNNSLESSMVWHNERKIKIKIWIWKNIYFYEKEKFKDFISETFNNSAGFEYFKDRYLIKEVEDKSHNKTGRIYVHIVIVKEIQDLLDDIEKFISFIHSIVKQHNKKQYLKVKDLGDKKRKVKPVYIWGSIYRKNLRIRNLNKKGNKICDFEWIHKSKNDKPIFLKNVINTLGVRIKFYNESS